MSNEAKNTEDKESVVEAKTAEFPETEEATEAELVDCEPGQKLQQVDNKTRPAVISQQDRFVEMALQSGNMEQLEKMLALKERYDKEEARKLFTDALARFKSNDVRIVKDRTVSFENNDQSITSYTHASLGNIVKMAVPALAKEGLSHRWDVKQEINAPIKVTCILTHKAGHNESVTMQAAADTSGKKNAIQQVASTVHYLQRYTFLSIAGLAVEEMDDDGRGAGVAGEPVTEYERVSEEQSMLIDSRITDNDLDMTLFKKWINDIVNVDGIDNIPAEWFDRTMKRIDGAIKMKDKSDS